MSNRVGTSRGHGIAVSMPQASAWGTEKTFWVKTVRLSNTFALCKETVDYGREVALDKRVALVALLIPYFLENGGGKDMSEKTGNRKQTGEEQIVRTICDSHCGGACVVNVHTRGNEIVRLETDDGEEAQLRACARGRAYRQRVYSADRLLYPLKRTGPRGAGEFARVSWDEATDIIAREMKRVRDTYGPASILFFCSMADAHAVNHEQAMHRLLCSFGGYTAPWGAISNEGASFSAGVTYGTAYGGMHMPEDYLNSRLIIMWGWDPATTIQGTNTAWHLARAKEAGTEIVSVDPRHTDSAAAFADEWIPIRPGTDTAVLVAMAYVIVKENLQDKRFIDTYTIGFDKFKDYLLGMEDGVEKTPRWAEEISGIPAASIADLARRYAGAKPAALIAGYAAGRTAFGEQYHRAASTLTAITGNIGVHGGSPAALTIRGGIWGGRSVFRALRSATHIASLPNQVESGAPPRWNALPHRGASVNSSARVNVSLFADAIIKGKAGGYPADFKLLWLSNTNYLNQLGDINKAAKAFEKLEFMLVTEQFMTSTAKFADIVLPVCTYMERNDFFASGNSDFYGLVNEAVTPLGESRSQLQICEALAEKLGITDYNDKTDEEWVKSIVAKLPGEEGFQDYRTLKSHGVHKLKSAEPVVGFKKEIDDPEHNPFPTRSGKIEIYSERVAEMNHPLIPPVPKYIETWESRNDPLAGKYPLQLITSHLKRRAHSQFDNLPWLRELQTQALAINPLDAGSRGVNTGDLVRVFNDRGEVVIPARVTERIMPGVVDMPQGAWYNPDRNGADRGGSANVLTKNATSPAGAFTGNTALVQVEKSAE
ncbi:MAG: molybdopterin-dependent oxidoreductase [Dehalococcoidia bacterium]|nr:molybdopterin-dependent oxidoreductase [Dehalococcoidia bacterium]